ncbi:hypothetical protein KAS14_03225 [Candidatus Bathyarchaeota archaeon]|nr:hypothetical protein [Candidatus Bathyarchaeota archaeon]
MKTIEERNQIKNEMLKLLDDNGVKGLDITNVLTDLIETFYNLRRKTFFLIYTGKYSQVKDEITSLFFKKHEIEVDDAVQILEEVLK